MKEIKLLRGITFFLLFLILSCGNERRTKEEYNYAVSGVRLKYSFEKIEYAACGSGNLCRSAITVINENNFPITVSVHYQQYLGEGRYERENKEVFILNTGKSKIVNVNNGPGYRDNNIEYCFLGPDGATHCSDVF